MKPAAEQLRKTFDVRPFAFNCSLLVATSGL
jgi:hypothetical protein